MFVHKSIKYLSLDYHKMGAYGGYILVLVFYIVQLFYGLFLSPDDTYNKISLYQVYAIPFVIAFITIMASSDRKQSCQTIGIILVCALYFWQLLYGLIFTNNRRYYLVSMLQMLTWFITIFFSCFCVHGNH